MVERVLSSEGKSASVERALTDIEQNVINSVVKILLDSLTETWRPVVDLSFAIRARETRPQMLQVASPNDTVVMLVFDLKIGEAQGMLNLCLPASIVEKTDSHFAGALDRHRREPTERERVWLTENLSRVPMPLTALIETRCTTRELVGVARRRRAVARPVGAAPARPAGGEDPEVPRPADGRQWPRRRARGASLRRRRRGGGVRWRTC